MSDLIYINGTLPMKADKSELVPMQTLLDLMDTDITNLTGIFDTTTDPTYVLIKKLMVSDFGITAPTMEAGDIACDTLEVNGVSISSEVAIITSLQASDLAQNISIAAVQSDITAIKTIVNPTTKIINFPTTGYILTNAPNLLIYYNSSLTKTLDAALIQLDTATTNITSL
jgi:hypothetical protein